MQDVSFTSTQYPTTVVHGSADHLYNTDLICVNCCRLLRWGTHTAAELEAADHANAAAELGDADLADRPKLLRWGINTTVDLAAANARAGIASLSIHDSIPDNSIEQPAAMLAPRWGFKLVVCINQVGSTVLHRVWHKAIHMMQEAQSAVR